MNRHISTILVLLTGGFVYAEGYPNVEAPYTDEECLDSYRAVAGVVSGLEGILKRPLENKAFVKRSFSPIMEALDKNNDTLVDCSTFHDHLGLNDIALQASSLKSVMSISLRNSESTLDEHDTMYKMYARNVSRLINAIERSSNK